MLILGPPRLSLDVTKSRSCEIYIQNYPIALKFNSRLGSIAVEAAFKFHSDVII